MSARCVLQVRSASAGPAHTQVVTSVALADEAAEWDGGELFDKGGRSTLETGGAPSDVKQAAMGRMRAERDVIRQVEREAVREATLIAGAGLLGGRPFDEAKAANARPVGTLAALDSAAGSIALAALASASEGGKGGKALGAVEEGAPDDEDLASMSDMSASFREWGTARGPGQ